MTTAFRVWKQHIVWIGLGMLVSLSVVGTLVFYAYSEGLRRPFVADDYQWLVNVRGLSFGELLRTAFNPVAQHHFYRPLVWLLIWTQMQLFGTDPYGYHLVSLGLHLLNAALLGWLVWRLGVRENRKQGNKEIGEAQIPALVNSAAPLFLISLSVAAAGIVALHPAIFEAITWMSAQSELLAATLLLLMLHVWVGRLVRSQESEVRSQKEQSSHHRVIASSHHLLGVTALFALALLTKESAVIGLPLLWLFADRRPSTADGRLPVGFLVKQYLLPVLVLIVYVGLQVIVERNNYLLQRGGYGLGWQLLLNPLRSLALIVAPLAGTEHADAAWLVPVGALVAIALLGWMFNFRVPSHLLHLTSNIRNLKTSMLLALVITLLPTAPFLSPPDSRYLYLPVLFAVLVLSIAFASKEQGARSKGQGVGGGTQNRWPFVGGRWSAIGGIVAVCVLLAAFGAAATEVRAREARWSAAGGPGGSLWRVAEQACAEKTTKRVVVVEPPLAAEHAQAIVDLACGDDTQAVVVSRADVDGAVKRRTVVISFPEGSAVVERRR